MDRIHTVICGFYDAALDPGRWEAAFEGLGDLLGGCAMGSSLQSGKGLDSVLALSRLDPHYTRVLHDYYATPDTNPMVAVMGNLPSSRAFARALVKPDADYRRSGLYNDVFRPQGLEHAAVACVLRSGDRFAPLGVFNRAGQEFGNEELKILDLAAPHIEKALHVHLRIGGSEAMRDATGHALDHLPVGKVFVAPDGSIRGMNGSPRMSSGRATACGPEATGFERRWQARSGAFTACWRRLSGRPRGTKTVRAAGWRYRALPDRGRWGCSLLPFQRGTSGPGAKPAQSCSSATPIFALRQKQRH